MPELRSKGLPSAAPEKYHRVSIGMPVYNGEKYIRDALESLLSQTYSDFELIISDNASTDGTGNICIEYAQKDSRISYVRQVSNQGPVANFQFVLDEAKGEFFMWAAHDDVWGEDFLAAGVEALVEDQKAIAAFGNVEYVKRGVGVFLMDSPPYGLSSDLNSRTMTYLQTNLTDHLIYGLYRRNFLLKNGWKARVLSPEKIIIFSAVVLGGYVNAPRMKLRIHYSPKTKKELVDLGFNASRWQDFYMSFLMAGIICRNVPFIAAIRLLVSLLRYRTPVMHRIMKGRLREHPGRLWLTNTFSKK